MLEACSKCRHLYFQSKGHPICLPSKPPMKGNVYFTYSNVCWDCGVTFEDTSLRRYCGEWTDYNSCRAKHVRLVRSRSRPYHKPKKPRAKSPSYSIYYLPDGSTIPSKK